VNHQWPAGFVEDRLAKERKKELILRRGGDPIRRIAQAGLKLSGLSARGRRNALDLQLELNNLRLPNWPDELHGFRILHLSDPHIPESGDDELIDGMMRLAQSTPHDLAVLTGDYRDRSFGPQQQAMVSMSKLRPALANQAIAILGNHDSIESVGPLQAAGYDVLVNETCTITYNGKPFDVLGVDDPSYYQQHDLNHCVQNASTDHRLLLSHSPDIYRDVEALSISVLLCGHTHGGQICTPSGYPIRHASKVDVELLSGSWTFGALQGYTSRGAGTSIIDARFFCPPELTIHTLLTR